MDAVVARTEPTEPWRGSALQERPGFLIRRLHQIHTAIFAREIGSHSLTPIMFSVLSALSQIGPSDQTTLAAAVEIDKTNMADVLERLKKRGLIRRRTSTKDRRVRMATLTDEGHALLAEVDAAAERAHHATLDGLSEDERDLFLTLMKRIVAHNTPAEAPRETADDPIRT